MPASNDNNVVNNGDKIDENKPLNLRLDHMKKILRLVELSKEADNNVSLTRGIFSDLKTLAFVSLMVLLIGIVFLVLKYSNFNSLGIKVSYASITGILGGTGLFKAAYD